MAAFQDLDDFDFGGDEADPNQTMVTGKRTFERIVEADEDEDSFPAKKQLTGEDFATTTILNLRANLEEKEAAVKALQEDLSAAQTELQEWRSKFQEASSRDLVILPTPSSVFDAITLLRHTNAHLREKAHVAGRRENAILAKSLEKDLQIEAFKDRIETLENALTPQVQETNRMLLDPIIHEEFTFLKSVIAGLEKKCSELEDELTAVQFTPQSRNGKMLMAKCRSLQEENDELGLQIEEGKIGELETKLALQKSLYDRLQTAFSEQQEYVEDMGEEIERLHRVNASMAKELRLKERDVARLSHRYSDDDYADSQQNEDEVDSPKSPSGPDQSLVGRVGKGKYAINIKEDADERT